MKDKIFNHKTDKAMKVVAIASSALAVFSLLLISVLIYLSARYSI